MNAPSDTPPPLQAAGPALSPGRTLRRLFLTLFLRGRSSRGLRKESAPKSVGSKLALALVFYALFGMFALFFLQQPVFALSVYLHAMTLVFLGMFVAASAGEVLFNKDEADILMHRPVTSRALLWAKIGVLTEVSLWLAGAFNLTGFFVGIGGKEKFAYYCRRIISWIDYSHRQDFVWDNRKSCSSGRKLFDCICLIKFSS